MIKSLGVYIDDSVVKKIVDEKEKGENIVVLHLKNQLKIAYIVDYLTMGDIKQRVKNFFGILKIGSKRFDLSNVDSVSINGQKIEA